MFGPPAYPSHPPPPPEKLRPMSMLGAALWVLAAQLGFLWLVVLILSLRGAEQTDVPSAALCQVTAYSGALFLILRVHGPEASIRNFVALRPTHPGFYPLALLTGVSGALPAHWLYELLDRRFPEPDGADDLAMARELYSGSTASQLLLVLALVVLSPFLEEMLFRGAIFGPLLRDRKPLAVIAVTGAFFALIHWPMSTAMPTRIVPILLMGLLLGYFRAASGSLLPAFAVHAAYNAVPITAVLISDEPPALDAEALPLSWAAAGLAVCVACLTMTQLLARRSRLAQKARAHDAAAQA